VEIKTMKSAAKETKTTAGSTNKRKGYSSSGADAVGSDPHGGTVVSTSSATPMTAGFTQCSVLDYPAFCTEFRFGNHGQFKGIVMRVCLPDGVTEYTTLLHADAQGVDVEYKWPRSMHEPSMQLGCVPEPALRALQLAYLEVLRRQNVPFKEGAKTVVRQRFPFKVQTDEERRGEVTQDTRHLENRPMKSIVLTFIAATEDLPQQLKRTKTL
jgi:hypothetical protein